MRTPILRELWGPLCGPNSRAPAFTTAWEPRPQKRGCPFTTLAPFSTVTLTATHHTLLVWVRSPGPGINPVGLCLLQCEILSCQAAHILLIYEIVILLYVFQVESFWKPMLRWSEMERLIGSNTCERKREEAGLDREPTKLTKSQRPCQPDGILWGADYLLEESCGVKIASTCTIALLTHRPKGHPDKAEATLKELTAGGCQLTTLLGAEH